MTPSLPVQTHVSWIAALPAATRRAVIFVIVVCSVLPLLLVAHYPLVDYPNHLGRFEICRVLAEGGSALQTFWNYSFAFVPNLASDVLIVPFTWFLPVEPAANLVTLLALVLLCVGTMLVDRHLNGERWGLSLFTGLLLYNGAFRYGFVNYIATVAAALLVFAAWIRWRDRIPGIGFPGFLAAAALLLAMHLYGFALYAVAVGGYEMVMLWDAWRQDRRGLARELRVPILGALSLLLPAALLLISPTSDDAAVLRWSTPLWKVEAAASPIFFNMPAVELPLLLVLGGLLVAGLLSGAVRLHRRMTIALGIMALMFLLLPRTLYGSNYADYRLLPGVGFFFLASLRLDMPASPRRRAVLLTVGLCLAVRVGSILVNWQQAQPILAEYEQALDTVPPGARLLVLQGSLGSTSTDRSPPLEHVAVFAGAKRGVFVPYTFHGASQLLHLQPAYAGYADAFAPYPQLASRMADYDYVLAIHNPKFTVPGNLSLKETARGESYVLYVVRPS